MRLAISIVIGLNDLLRPPHLILVPSKPLMWMHISKEYVFYGLRVPMPIRHPGEVFVSYTVNIFVLEIFIVQWYCPKSVFTNTLKKWFHFYIGVRARVLYTYYRIV
jgi:hypothetical protein